MKEKNFKIVVFKQIVKEICGGSVVNPKLREEVERRDKAEWDIGERFWIDKIENSGGKTILFICGSDHVDRIKNLCRSRNIKHSVVTSDFDG